MKSDTEHAGTHAAHCCILHGCNYGQDDCPVNSGSVLQKYLCEECEDDGIESVEELLLRIRREEVGTLQKVTDAEVKKLIEWADKLSEALDRQEEKGGGVIVLYNYECRELIAVMLRAVGELHEGVNGA